MRIEFRRSGGHLPVELSADLHSEHLSARDAQELKELVAAGGLEKLNAAHVTPAPDAFTYRLAVTTDEGKRDEVELGEEAVPIQLRPLLRWLISRAKRVPVSAQNRPAGGA